MSRKRVGQLGFEDAVVEARVGDRVDHLSRIEGLLDWGPFAALLEGLYPSRRGEPAYPPLIMFKVLLLQRWYSLSDPGMEEALADRISFRRFAGLSLSDPVPDHTTIHRFRDRLCAGERLQALMAELARQLDACQVVLRQGTLIDASLVSSAARRPRVKEGKTSRVDPDARFGANNERRRYEFGYKLHVAVDQGSALIRGLCLSPANRQEVDFAASLVQGDEQAVYADRGYDAQHLHDHLAALGITDGVMRRARKGKPLGQEEIKRNHRLVVHRRPVEKIFGTLKRCYRMNRLPHFSLARNQVTISLACFAYNLRRLATLSTA